MLSRAPTGPHCVARVPFDQDALRILVMKDLRAFPRRPIDITLTVGRNERERSTHITATETPLDPP
jgi:hypothetical protein